MAINPSHLKQPFFCFLFALSMLASQASANQPPLVTRRSPVANPAAITEGGYSSFSVTASDSTDPDVATRGMSNITWYADGILRQETKLGAPSAIASSFTYRPPTNTVQGELFREVPVKAVALDRQGAMTETLWTLRVNNLQAAQTITFLTPPVLAVGAPDFDPGARASSGLPVSYASSAPTVAEIVDGRIRIVGAGTAVITASQPGDTEFKAATAVKRTLTVKALVTAAAEPAAGGTVTGTGLFVRGTRVALTAKPALGHTFLRWEDGTQGAARSLLIAGSNVAVTAFFGMTTNIVSPAVANPGAQSAMVGVLFTLPLAIESASLPTVTVTGLPSGLTYNTAGRSISGVPTVATKAATTNTPAETKTVTITAKNVNPVPDVQRFAMTVDPLPLWAWGEFNGFCQDEAMGPGTASMSVTLLGKITGKFSVAGTNFAFNALSYTRRDAAGDFWFSGRAVASSVSLPMNLRVSLPTFADELGVVTQTLAVAEGWLSEELDGWPAVTMYRRVWKDAGMTSALTNYTGYYTATLPGNSTFGSGYLALTVDSAGGVKTAGKLADGTAVSQSGVLILDEVGRAWTVLHTAPAAYRGGCLFGLAEFLRPDVTNAVCVQLLDGVSLSWENRYPLATEEYGAGFLREVGLAGGRYSTLINLRAFYTGGLAVGVDDLPVLHATSKVTDWNDTETAKYSTLAAVEVEAAPAAPDGLLLRVTPSTGVGTGLAAPSAQTPAWDSEMEDYNYGDLTNPSAFAIAFTRATGLFSGTFKIWYDYLSAQDNTTDSQTRAHISKSVSYSGILTPVRADAADGVEGRAFFLWPESTFYVNVLNKPVTYTFNRSFDVLLLPAESAP